MCFQGIWKARQTERRRKDQTMVRPEFTEEEAVIVREILESFVAGLPSEIYGMDSISFRKTEELMHKEVVAKELIERLERTAA
jgi:hypothetical protein